MKNLVNKHIINGRANPHCKPVKCCFKNIKSGKVVRANSLHEFAFKVGLNNDNAVQHMSDISCNRRLAYKNWWRKDILQKKLNLKDCYNVEYNYSVEDLVKRFKISSCGINRLLKGGFIKGLFAAKFKHKFLQSQSYIINKYRFQYGKQSIVGKTLDEVSKKVGHSIGYLSQIVHGKAYSNKLKFNSVDLTPKSILK